MALNGLIVSRVKPFRSSINDGKWMKFTSFCHKRHCSVSVFWQIQLRKEVFYQIIFLRIDWYGNILVFNRRVYNMAFISCCTWTFTFYHLYYLHHSILLLQASWKLKNKSNHALTWLVHHQFDHRSSHKKTSQRLIVW